MLLLVQCARVLWRGLTVFELEHVLVEARHVEGLDDDVRGPHAFEILHVALQAVAGHAENWVGEAGCADFTGGGGAVHDRLWVGVNGWVRGEGVRDVRDVRDVNSIRQQAQDNRQQTTTDVTMDSKQQPTRRIFDPSPPKTYHHKVHQDRIETLAAGGQHLLHSRQGLGPVFCLIARVSRRAHALAQHLARQAAVVHHQQMVLVRVLGLGG